MPIYEFRCKKCKKIFESLFYSLQEKRAVTCPFCKSRRTERVMSIFGGKFGTASSGAGCSTCSTTSCPPS